MSKGKRDLLRDQATPAVLGYKLRRVSLVPKREYVDITAPGDYGADPLDDDTFRMVPSGDIVDACERDRRLGK